MRYIVSIIKICLEIDEIGENLCIGDDSGAEAEDVLSCFRNIDWRFCGRGCEYSVCVWGVRS